MCIYFCGYLRNVKYAKISTTRNFYVYSILPLKPQEAVACSRGLPRASETDELTVLLQEGLFNLFSLLLEE